MPKLITFLSLLLLVSCGSFKSKEPEKLEKIKSNFLIKAVWVKDSNGISPNAYRQLPITIDEEKIYIAHARGRVSSLEFSTGEEIWQVDTGEQLLSGPGVGGNTLVVTTKEAGVIALSADKGELLWRTKLVSEVIVSPLIYEEKVFIQSIDGTFNALNIKTGEKVWVQSRIVPPLSLRGSSRPVIVEDNIVAGFADGKLVSYDIASGKMVWETTIAVPRGRTDLERIVDIDGVFSWQDGVLYAVSYQGRIVALSASDGQIIWAREMSSYAGVILEQEQVFVTDAKGFVWALDRQTGATLWRQEKLEGRNISVPVIMKEALVVTDLAGYVHLLAKDDGHFIDRRKVEDFYRNMDFDISEEYISDMDLKVTSLPKVKENMLVVRDNEGTLGVFKVLPLTN